MVPHKKESSVPAADLANPFDVSAAPDPSESVPEWDEDHGVPGVEHEPAGGDGDEDGLPDVGWN